MILVNQTRETNASKKFKLSEKNKKYLDNITTRGGFIIRKWITKCYFHLKKKLIHLKNKQSQNHQKPLDFELKKQMEFFSFSPPVNLVAEDKRLLAVTDKCEATNSVFNVTENGTVFQIHHQAVGYSKVLRKLSTI